MDKILADNKKAYFDYEILEKFNAGIALIGQEVKSIKNGHISIKGAYVVIDNNGEVFMIGSNVPAYQPKNAPSNYNQERSRKLLLKKSEIQYLIGKSSERSLTMVPLRVYTVKGKIKIEFGLGKGKRKFDKRELIKKREAKREIDRSLKNF